jgi:putative transposase
VNSHAGIQPARGGSTPVGQGFPCRQAASILECEFLTVDTLFFKRFYVRFVIELARRRVRLCGVTADPDSAWVTHRARNLLMRLDDEGVRGRRRGW